MPETATLTVQTPTGHVAVAAVDALQVLLSDGWAALFPNHAAFVALVRPGVARIETAGRLERIAHGHGLLTVRAGAFHLYCGAAVPMAEGEAYDEVLSHSATLRQAGARDRQRREWQLEAALWRTLERRGGVTR